MKHRLPLCALVFSLLAAGCVSEAEQYAKRTNDSIWYQELKNEMSGRAYREFPAVYADMNAAARSGKKLGAPRMLKAVKPKYPFMKGMKGEQGSLWVAFTIDKNGDVSRVKPLLEKGVSEKNLFVQAATTAVKQWKFSPATVGGEPMPYIFCVPVVFMFR